MSDRTRKDANLSVMPAMDCARVPSRVKEVTYQVLGGEMAGERGGWMI